MQYEHARCIRTSVLVCIITVAAVAACFVFVCVSGMPLHAFVFEVMQYLKELLCARISRARRVQNMPEI